MLDSYIVSLRGKYKTFPHAHLKISLLRRLLLLPVDLSGQRNLICLILASALLLKLSDKWQNLLTKLLDLFIIVQERSKDDIRAQTLQQQNPVGNLLLGANELRLEAIVVLHQILELGVCPHASLVCGGSSSVLDLLTEAFDGFRVGFALDLLQDTKSFLFGVAADDEAVERELDFAFAALLFGSLADVCDAVHATRVLVLA